MPYYIAAFFLLYVVRLRRNAPGWKRTLVAFIGGALLALLAGHLLSRLLGLVLAAPRFRDDGLPFMTILMWGTSVGFGLIDALIGVAAVAWLARGRRMPTGTAITLPADGPVARPVAPAPGFAPASVPGAVPGPAPVAPPGVEALDATAAETLRLLIEGLSSPQADVRRECASLMAKKFLPALAHEPDLARSRRATETVQALAAEVRSPADDSEHRDLAHAVGLYTRLTSEAPGDN